jgi:hypothetical protein
MTYNVHQHWDPLKVCAVGRSYPPEFYSFIANSRVRSVMERIAVETEEDYQKLIKLLESFGVEIVRTEINPDFSVYLNDGKYSLPKMMTPRDYTAMIGDQFFMPAISSSISTEFHWNMIKGTDWPKSHPRTEEEFNILPTQVKKELSFMFNVKSFSELSRPELQCLISIESLIKSQGNKILYDTGTNINTAMTSRIGKDLYFGTETYVQDQTVLKQKSEELFPDYRCHIINTGGHADSTFCPVVPGLIVSLYDVPTYSDTFPDWEVVYLPGQSWESVRPFLNLKEKNRGKWWVPGEELNDDFTEFVESWLSHWVGYVEETVFDVNMLVIDEKNVVCNNYNEKVFEAFSRHGITPHIVNFRHRYFWDGGLHCITSDLHREGTQKDYFPERG